MSDPHGIITLYRKGGGMRTVSKLRAMTVGTLVDEIYDDNYSHLEFMDNMGGDCDCNIHSALNLILEYWEVK
jgi:predicted DNA-binding ribbon-helix-helix protein